MIDRLDAHLGALLGGKITGARWPVPPDVRELVRPTFVK